MSEELEACHALETHGFFEEQTRSLLTEKVRAFYAGSVMGLDAGGQISKMVEAEIKRRFELWKGRQVIATKEG